MTLAAVRLWGSRIGAVSWDEDAELASFEYDPAFRGSGIELAPIAMPLSRRIHQFPQLPRGAFRGLPGLLADSLPDRYGNALLDAWLARQGRELSSFNPVERLCYVGRRGMGALEYEPADGPGTRGETLDVAALIDLAGAVLAERAGLHADLGEDEKALRQILQVGTSAGGARAKALIAWNAETGELRTDQADLPPGFGPWILKFDGLRSADAREVSAPHGYGLIEIAYSEMARAAGIDMSACRILAEGGRHHFMTRRFDRDAAGRKSHLQSLGALAHFDYNAAGAYSYEQAIEVMRRLGSRPDEIAQQFRRAVFNVLARNQDDHVKNISFLMDRQGRWSLSPAYDITHAHAPTGVWTSKHQMSLNGKRDGFSTDDLLSFARACGLNATKARAMLGEVRDAVSRWPHFAKRAGVGSHVIRAIAEELRLGI